MDVGTICTRDVVTCTADDTIVEAAMLMREHHVGDLVVVAPGRPEARPIGMITDRDIVVGVVARGAEYLADLAVGDVLTGELVTCGAELTPSEALEIMRENGVRRLPVVDGSDRLVGVITLDDLVGFLAEELSAVSNLVGVQRQREASFRA